MQYTVICANKRCGKRYAPRGEQLAWIERAAQSGMQFIMIACQHCGHQMGFNPQEREGEISPKPTYLCCPIESCDGFIVPLPGADHSDVEFGCGECGNEWSSKADLDRAVSAIITKYPYRAACYTKTASGWAPVEYDKLPSDYHALVAAEWKNVPKRS